MDVREAVQRRRALRAIGGREIDKESISALVESMRLAPSCFNYQPWRVVLCTGDTLVRLRECLNRGNAWATTAPLIIVLAAKPSDDCRHSEGRDYYQFCCGLAVGQMVLQATELGLVAHPIAGFDPVKVHDVLKVPADYVVITCVICGHPIEDESMLSEGQRLQQRERPPRKPVEHNFYDNVWGEPLRL